MQAGPGLGWGEKQSPRHGAWREEGWRAAVGTRGLRSACGIWGAFSSEILVWGLGAAGDFISTVLAARGGGGWVVFNYFFLFSFSIAHV